MNESDKVEAEVKTVVKHVRTSCRKCGSKARLAYFGVKTLVLGSGAKVIKRRTKCRKCGQARIDTFRYDESGVPVAGRGAVDVNQQSKES